MRSLCAVSIALSCATVVLVGCSASQPAPESTPSYETSPALLPGDAVRVQVWREVDISGTFSVDDRGVVTFPLLGERRVAGYDPRQLRDLLLEDYRQYLQNPSVEVTVLRRINILGEVRSPGLYPVDATVSLSDALAMAGGIAPSGDPNKVQLIRGDQVIVQRMDQTVAVGATEVRSGDQLIVGRKGWMARNTGAIVGGLIAASAIVAAAFISN